MNTSIDYPLFVDLDGTYTKTDLLVESFVTAVKHNPLIIFSCLLWLLQGRSVLKQKLAETTDLKTDTLPLNQEFVGYLKEEKARGRKIILATASNEKFARSVVAESDIFDDQISSSAQVNLKGRNKLDSIRKISPDFAYAGNDAVDFEIFEHANESILVNPSSSAKRRAKSVEVNRTFDDQKTGLRTWVKQLRVHQWLKNLLVMVPLVVAGEFTNVSSVLTAIAAFFSFSFLASSTYIMNDLLDLESDRMHARKRNRPLAAGTINISSGILVGAVLFIAAFSIGFATSPLFALVLLGYLAITLSYSLKLKQHFGMDVVALAILYTVRIIAGAAAIGVVVSFWLFAFSIFVFLSLALVKRCSEIKSLQAEGKLSAGGRDYHVDDYIILVGFGTASAMMAVFMYCLYVNHNVLTNQYQQPDLLWASTPALCYWLIRMWVKTHRGEMHDDPIVFSLKDWGSLVTVGFVGILTIIAQVI